MKTFVLTFKETNLKSSKKHPFIFFLALIFMLTQSISALAQNCYTIQGCQDYSNFGRNSDIAGDLEYDNFVSGYHQSVARDASGKLMIWGELTHASGTGHLLSPTEINSTNFPGLTGSPLKAGIGSYGSNRAQLVLLTTDGLWVSGYPNVVISDDLKADAAFGQLSLGLPESVLPTDVKMLFVTSTSIAITTCGGNVWVLTRNSAPGNAVARGDGSTGTPSGWDETWAQVKTAPDTPLTGVVATRGAWGMFFALTNEGKLYTWGSKTWLGTGAAETANEQRAWATDMTVPSTTEGPIKMIGVTGNDDTQVTYYVLYQNGKLFAMGDNTSKQKGDFGTTSNGVWVTPSYPGGAPMNDIAWISPNEHDRTYPFINVLNTSGHVFNWGVEDRGSMGRADVNASAFDPGEPASLISGGIQVVESGGHTTLVIDECEANFGYVGHKVDGSMGDGTTVNAYQPVYSYQTSGLLICGAAQVSAAINLVGNPVMDDDGNYCMTSSITLNPFPAGGTLSVTTGAGLATLTGNTLNLTGKGLVTLQYTVNVGTCGDVTVTRVFNVSDCSGLPVTFGAISAKIDGSNLLLIGRV